MYKIYRGIASTIAIYSYYIYIYIVIPMVGYYIYSYYIILYIIYCYINDCYPIGIPWLPSFRRGEWGHPQGRRRSVGLAASATGSGHPENPGGSGEFWRKRHGPCGKRGKIRLKCRIYMDLRGKSWYKWRISWENHGTQCWIRKLSIHASFNMGKSFLNVGSSIVTFDYRRVLMIYHDIQGL